MYDTGDGGKEKKGLLGEHAVAFWSVVSGIIALITLVVTLVTLHPSPGPTPNPSPSAPPGSVTPSPSPTSTTSPSSPALYFQYNGVSQYPCSDQYTIHSVGGGTKVSFVFMNQSPYTVQVDWITSAGAREEYDTLAPGGSYPVNTYTGQVWLIANFQSACLGYFYVTNGGYLAVK